MHRKKQKKTNTHSRHGVVHCTEYKCGCIMHPLAGYIRKCGALGARSLSGRTIKLEGDAGKHTKGEVAAHYPVANILP